MAGEVREREYVEAAESFGAGRWHLMKRHLLPELRGLAANQFLLLLPGYVLAEVTLTFFGLGVGEPAASWGNLLIPLRHPATAANCLQLAAPLPVLALLVLSCELLGRERARQSGMRPAKPRVVAGEQRRRQDAGKAGAIRPIPLMRRDAILRPASGE